MPALDGETLKWLLGTLGVAGGWCWDRWNKRSRLAKSEAEAKRAVAALQETIATKDRELDDLRDEVRMLHLALNLTQPEAHG